MEIAPLSIAASAHLNGQHTWMCRRLFEVMGTAVAKTPDLEAKLMLGVHCYHYSSHAERFEALLPTPVDEHPYGVANAPTGGAAACLDAIANATTTVEIMVGIYRVVLPHFRGLARHHDAQCNPVTDAPTIRALDGLLMDLDFDSDDGKTFLVTFLSSERGKQADDTWRHHLERLWDPLSDPD